MLGLPSAEEARLTLAKRLANVLAASDAQKQCARDPECHRLDGHEGDCKGLRTVLVEKAEAWLKEKLA